MNQELHQLFDPQSSTFTYVLVDRATREAIVIDSVDQHFDRDIALLRRLGAKLRFVVETHTHADHGNTVSTVGHEKRHNPRLAGQERASFIELMANLQLPRPTMMDVAVPANLQLGLVHAV